MSEQPLIEGHRLTKAYGNKKNAKVAVADVDLTINQGDLYVLMGLSGSGKSTVLRMLNHLIEPTSGSVKLDGRDLAELSKAELREVRNRRISMVFQHFALFPHWSVRDNAAYGLRLRGEDRKLALKRADEALDVVGLGQWGHVRPDELSGGMKQRVGLARALTTDADILLMDEPFSALDPLIRREMQDLLVTLSRELQRTVVFVTHDLNEALRLGDRITLLSQGAVAQTGTAAEILTQPADDYVRKFIGEVDRTRVLTAGDVMHAGTRSVQAGSISVGINDVLTDVAATLTTEHAQADVVDDGRVVGYVTTNDVLDAVGQGARAA